ncbi:MAG TPA: helix-turn-helix domain-containing protein [Terriglobales bacterium]|nr:helix-turn-helix domain-containing protein [Terriglobales bacterium]
MKSSTKINGGETRKTEFNAVVNGDPLLSICDAAVTLGVSPWTIRQWLTQRKLKRTKVGARTLIRASQLKRIIREE